MPGRQPQKLANLRALYAYLWAHPGKKLLFMGGELGQWVEWDCEKSLDWHLLQYEPHQKLSAFLSELNRLYLSKRALWENDYSWEGFEWIDFNDRDSSVISFLRWSRDHQDCAVFVCNFTPVPRHDYRVGVPFAGRYRRLLDSDSGAFWGSGYVPGDELQADAIGWQGKPASIALTLPPLATLILEPVR